MTIIITVPEVATSYVRSLINEYMYCIRCDAQRNDEVEQLIHERDAAVREAYRFSYGVAIADEMAARTPCATDFVALNIVALKERYAKRIRRCEIRHNRFKRLVEQIMLTSEKDACTLLEAFCTNIEVDEREVKRILRKHLSFLKDLYGSE